jgi:hypothetical protein
MAAPRAKRAGEKCAGKPRLQSLHARKCTGRDDRIRSHDRAASTWRSTSVSSPDSDIDRASQVGLLCFSRERTFHSRHEANFIAASKPIEAKADQV